MEPKTKTPYEKLEDFAMQFRDVRAIGLLLFVVIVLLVSWSGVKVIDTNYRLQKDIARLEQQNDVAELTNANLKLQNEYYATDQYLDIAARQDFGLAAAGETVLNVPREVALAHTVDLPNAEQVETKKTKARQPAYQRNFQSWVNFLMGRQPAED